jgi:hypothetical protein
VFFLTPEDQKMFMTIIGILMFLGILLAASLCIIAGHADSMLEDIEYEMREQSLEAVFENEKAG